MLERDDIHLDLTIVELRQSFIRHFKGNMSLYEHLLSALGLSLQTLLWSFSLLLLKPLTTGIKLQCLSHTICTMHMNNILNFACIAVFTLVKSR